MQVLSEGQVKYLIDYINPRLSIIQIRQLGSLIPNLKLNFEECYTNWYDQLIGEISKSETSIVVPVIETIKETNFEMSLTKLSKTPIYGFDWSLNFQKILSPKKSKKSKGKVLKSPVIGRGIFAILSLGVKFYVNHIFV